MVVWWLILAVGLVALLYSCVGHGGASGYLAVLTLAPGAFAPAEMATTALILNLLVSALAWFSFSRKGYFDFSITWPFIVTSVPAAFIGGLLSVPEQTYALLLAFSLLFAAFWLLKRAKSGEDSVSGKPSIVVALPSGGAIGLLSGIVGVGGGIFLSPLMIIKRWATTKQVAATSALFIFVNSLAGLVGRLADGSAEFGDFLPLVLAAFVGGLVGSTIGAEKFSGRVLKAVLAAVLVFASFKLIKVGFSG